MRMGLGLNLAQRRSSGAAAFNPLTAMTPNLWIDASDSAMLFQDSAATTPAVVDQPLGRVSDKSGSGKHIVQATTAAKPVYRLTGGKGGWENDGVDDFLATAAGLTWPASVDVFIVMSNAIDDQAFTIAQNSSGGGADYIAIGAIGSAVGGESDMGGGAVPQYVPTYVNNVVRATRGDVYTATAGGAAKVVELRGVPFANYAQIYFGFTSGMFVGRFHEVLICPAQSDAARTQYRDYLTAKWGVA
jgi:hypothetical protein